MKFSKCYVFILILGLFVGCKSNGGGQDEDNKMKAKFDQIDYHYQDSSVPPPYHKSYTIEVTAKQSHKVVSGYSDVLSEDNYPITSVQWEQLVQQSAKLQKEGSYEALGATGTSGNTIELIKDGKVIYHLYWDSLSKNKVKEATTTFKDTIHATTES